MTYRQKPATVYTDLELEQIDEGRTCQSVFRAATQRLSILSF